MPTRDQPIQTYFPSARARLIVRLEDYGAPSTPLAPTKPTTLRKGVTSQNSASLKVVNQDGAFLLVGPGDDPSHVGSPQQQQSSSDGLTFVLDGIIPARAGWLQNGIRTADTLTLEIQFADMPIDPRVIRSCAVQFYLGTVSAQDYELGLNGSVRAPALGSGVSIPFNVIPDGYTDAHGRARTNLRFEGWVDDWAIDFPEGDGPVLKLECTDNTRLLIDQDAPPKLTIGTDQPLDVAIANYLANFPQFRGISVTYLPAVSRDKIPVLKQVLKATAFQPKLGPAPAGGGTSKLKVWDYITDVCGSVAHICRFEGTTLIVQKPRAIYNGRLPPRSDDPFTGRTLQSGVVLRNRLYLYGDNIAEMKYQRKWAQFAPQNIEARAYDISGKHLVVERFPLKGDRTKRLNPGDSADEKWHVILVPIAVDRATLRAIAQTYYETVGRRELGVTVVTKNLGSYGGGNLDPDTFDSKVGDPIDVSVGSQATINNTVIDVGEQMRTRASEFLRGLGFSPGFADAYQKAANAIGLPSTYRARTIGCQWDGQSDSVTLTLELINYVEVRADKQLPAGEELTAADVAGNSPDPVTVQDSDIGAGI